MKKYSFLFFSLSFVLFFIASSCKKDSSSASGKTIEIGVLLPLTGTAASIGQSSNEAIIIAQEDIQNYLQQIGSDITVKIRIEDTQTDTAVVLQKIQLLKNEGIQLVVGPYSSAEVKAVKSYVDNNQMLAVSPASVATSLAIPDDNILRLVPSDYSQADALDAWLVSDDVEMLVAVVRDDLWGRELFSAVTDKFTSHGGIVADPVYYSPTDQDFTAEIQTLAQEVQTLQNANPLKKAGIYLASYGEGCKILSAASVSSTLSPLGWYGNSAFANNTALTTDFMIASYAHDHHLVCPVFGLDEAASDKWKPLQDKLTQKLGRTPEVYAMVAYDVVWLAVLSYLNTGLPVQTSRLKTAFTTMADNYYGVSGRTRLDAAGDRIYAIYDFWGVGYLLNDYCWVKSGWYDNNSGNLIKF